MASTNPILAGLDTARNTRSNRIMNEYRQAQTLALNMNQLRETNNADYMASIARYNDAGILRPDNTISGEDISELIKNDDPLAAQIVVDYAQTDDRIKENKGFNPLGLSKGPVVDGKQTFAIVGEYDEPGPLGKAIRFITQNRTIDENDPVEFGTADQIGELIARQHNHMRYKPGVATNTVRSQELMKLEDLDQEADAQLDQLTAGVTSAMDLIGNQDAKYQIMTAVVAEPDPFKKVEILRGIVNKLATVESEGEAPVIDPNTQAALNQIADKAQGKIAQPSTTTSVDSTDDTTNKNIPRELKEVVPATAEPLGDPTLTKDTWSPNKVYSEKEYKALFPNTAGIDGPSLRSLNFRAAKIAKQQQRIENLDTSEERKNIERKKLAKLVEKQNKKFNELVEGEPEAADYFRRQRADGGFELTPGGKGFTITSSSPYNTRRVRKLYEALAANPSSEKRAEIDAKIEEYVTQQKKKDPTISREKIDFVRNNSMDKAKFRDPNDFAITSTGRDTQKTTTSSSDADSTDETSKSPELEKLSKAAEANKEPLITKEEKAKLEQYLDSLGIKTIKDVVTKTNRREQQGIRAFLSNNAATTEQKNAINKEFRNVLQTGDPGFSSTDLATAQVNAQNAATSAQNATTAYSNSQREWKKFNDERQNQISTKFKTTNKFVDDILKEVQGLIFDEEKGEFREFSGAQEVGFSRSIDKLAERHAQLVARAQTGKASSIVNQQSQIIERGLNASLSLMIQHRGATKGRDWFRGDEPVTFGDNTLNRIRVLGRDKNGNPNEYGIVSAAGGSLTGSKIPAEEMASYLGGKDSQGYKYLMNVLKDYNADEGA